MSDDRTNPLHYSRPKFGAGRAAKTTGFMSNLMGGPKPYHPKPVAPPIAVPVSTKPVYPTRRIKRIKKELPPIAIVPRYTSGAPQPVMSVPTETSAKKSPSVHAMNRKRQKMEAQQVKDAKARNELSPQWLNETTGEFSWDRFLKSERKKASKIEAAKRKV